MLVKLVDQIRLRESGMNLGACPAGSYSATRGLAFQYFASDQIGFFCLISFF